MTKQTVYRLPKKVDFTKLKPFREGLNLQLFSDICNKWIEEPRRLDMYEWLNIGREFENDWESPPCNTVGCIEGWARFLSSKNNFVLNGFLALGVAYGSDLAYPSGWPRKYSTSYKDNWNNLVDARTNKNQKQYLKIQKQLVAITIARIKHYILTGE